jgi:hypothetical protein
MHVHHSVAVFLPLLAVIGTAVVAPAQRLPGEPKPAAKPAIALTPDPYFRSTGAKTTSHMPRVIIRNIRQDRAGRIWFATFGGPIRYDGKTFTNFSEEVGLAKRRVFSLQEDRSGGQRLDGASRS